jgi:uncharacterized membrane protein YhiD involved in acid resistance
MLVAVGACLLMLLSMEMKTIYSDFGASSVVRVEGEVALSRTRMRGCPGGR